MSSKAGRGSDQFVARLPEGLRERIKKVAETNGRSMNAEVVQALRSHVEAEEYHSEIQEAQNAWLQDPNFKAPEYAEPVLADLPATKGDVDRLLTAIKELLAQR